MKKKLLAGLLTITACFSLGSTSFAASTSPLNPGSVTTSQGVSTQATYQEVIVNMQSGYWKHFPGLLQQMNNDGAFELYEDGWVQAIKYGAGDIWSYDEYGNITVYIILVDRK